MSRKAILLLLASSFWVETSEAAILLSVDTLTNNTTFTLEGATNSREGRSELSTTLTGGTASTVGNFVIAETRYASIATADNGNGSNPADSVQVNSNYTVVFSVLAAVGDQYTLDIATRLSGALTLFDDYSLGNGTSGQATISNVAGSLNSVPDPGLNLASATSSPNGTSGSSDTPLFFTNSLSLGPFFGTGSPQTYAFSFVFDTFAISRATSSTFDNADEAAARLGLAGTITGGGGTFEAGGTNNISADDYPGQGSRVQADDGHFIRVTATYTAAIPEPSSVALAAVGLGLGGIICMRRTRRAPKAA